MPDKALTAIALGDEPESAEASLQALGRALRRADGFTLLVAVCNEPALRDRLLDRLDELLPAPAVRVAVPAECSDVLPLVQGSLADEPSRPAVMITGLASGIRSAAPNHARLRSLNHRREEWRENVPAPVVFWLPEYLLQAVAQQSPDFLDWRSGTFLFLAPLGRVVDPLAVRSTPEVWRLLESERRQRMAQLREWLTAPPHPRDGRPDPAAIRWRLELAGHHGRLGELDECLGLAREVLAMIPPDDLRNRAFAWDLIADVLYVRGEFDEALRIRRKEELPVFERLGDERSKAVAQGKIADVLQARGELDEALRIRREEQLPIYDRLRDDREQALTHGKIADILETRGELHEALRIRRDEELPVYERLGDVRSKAVTQGKIADMLQAQGELDEALHILREAVLPAYGRLGDIRSKARAQGKVADLLQAWGELDEALRIRREEVLPVYERLGDVRSKAVAQDRIADVLQARGELDEALRIRREEVLPVFERVGDVRGQVVAQANLALILLSRNAPGDREEAAELLCRAHATADRMRIPEAAHIRATRHKHGLAN